jgi:hypothetical protein
MSDSVLDKGKEYHEFCVSIKQRFGINLNPNDEIFPLIFTLITENEKSSETIKRLEGFVSSTLKNIEDTNTNLYTNQTILLDKNKAILQEQQKALNTISPKNRVIFDSPESVKEFWQEKTRFWAILLLGSMSFLFIAVFSFIALSGTWRVQRWLDNARVEQGDKGEKYLLLEKAESSSSAKVGENYFIWKEDNIAIPIE